MFGDIYEQPAPNPSVTANSGELTLPYVADLKR